METLENVFRLENFEPYFMPSFIHKGRLYKNIIAKQKYVNYGVETYLYLDDNGAPQVITWIKNKMLIDYVIHDVATIRKNNT